MSNALRVAMFKGVAKQQGLDDDLINAFLEAQGVGAKESTTDTSSTLEVSTFSTDFCDDIFLLLFWMYK